MFTISASMDLNIKGTLKYEIDNLQFKHQERHRQHPHNIRARILNKIQTLQVTKVKGRSPEESNKK